MGRPYGGVGGSGGKIQRTRKIYNRKNFMGSMGARKGGGVKIHRPKKEQGNTKTGPRIAGASNLKEENVLGKTITRVP